MRTQREWRAALVTLAMFTSMANHITFASRVITTKKTRAKTKITFPKKVPSFDQIIPAEDPDRLRRHVHTTANLTPSRVSE